MMSRGRGLSLPRPRTSSVIAASVPAPQYDQSPRAADGMTQPNPSSSAIAIPPARAGSGMPAQVNKVAPIRRP